MAFSEKQQQIFKFGYSNYDALIADGAIRSGKTSAMVIAFVLWAMSKYNGMNFALCSKTVRSCQRNIIKPLLNIKYMNIQFNMRYSSSENLLTVTRGNKINYFYVFGGRDEASYTTIQGITLAGILLDEVVLMPKSFVEMAIGRCSIVGSKFWFSCNPEGPSHWFYKEWILKIGEKNVMYLHFTMDDNPSLALEIKKRYETMFIGVFYDRYIRGLWVKAEGIIYRIFANNPEKFILDTVPKDIIIINCGIDFGGNKSATTFIATGFTAGMQNVVILESERHTEELSPDMLDNIFVDFATMVYAKYNKNFNCRADSAEPVLIRGLRNAVIRNHLHTHILLALKREIKERINLVCKLLGLGRFYVLRHNKNVIDALSQALWSEKHPDERLDDGTSDIDTLDAMEYSIEEYTNNLIDIRS